MVRVYGIAEPDEESDVEYLLGLQGAVTAALDHAIESLEVGEDQAPPIPAALVAQARLAARHGIGLDIVLRRYFSGFMLLSDFVMEEAEAALPLHGTSLHRAVQAQSAQLDRVLTVLTEEYKRELESHQHTSESRRVGVVKRLLAGEQADGTDLGYLLERWHIAGVLSWEGDTGFLREIASRLDYALLRVSPAAGDTWVWFGSSRRTTTEVLSRQAEAVLPPGARLAIGEPGLGIAGWRLTFNQARQVAAFAREGSPGVIRFADLGLLASISSDRVMVDSLKRQYLHPLSGDRDGGRALRETLRAYLAGGRNITSAAAAMGINRHTVRRRLRLAEERLGRVLDDCAVELEVALKLEECWPYLDAP